MLGALLFCVAAGARIFAAQIRRYFSLRCFLLRATELRRFNKLRSSGGLKKSAEFFLSRTADGTRTHHIPNVTGSVFSPNYQRR